MSLWWVRRDQLDPDQVRLIETLPLRENHLVLGPPGCGKTNVVLRRAQFVRTMEMPNVLVLTFTRSLTEFVKTGCYDDRRREIFPPNCVTTLESWIRWLYGHHRRDLPQRPEDRSLIAWKKVLAEGALAFRERSNLPMYDALFVDEAQDLINEEIALLRQWTNVLFYAGDDRQQLYEDADGLPAVRSGTSNLHEHVLQFHYRLGPEICKAADRILIPTGGRSLESTSHYNGPLPSRFKANGPLTRNQQLERAATRIKQQLRAYGDLIRQGDLLGVVVARRDDREAVLSYFEQDPELVGQSKIIRARGPHESQYDPSFQDNVPICILTVKGCKGIEFRALHWLFCETLSHHATRQMYYTVVTRAKTRLDYYYSSNCPQELAQAQSPVGDRW